MALRSTRPALAEYDAVLQDPSQYEALVDGYLASAAFGATVRQSFSEWMELDQAPDVYPAGFPAVGPLASLGTHQLNTSIIQAPGRLAEYIVMNDLPWSEIVTAQYTLADEVVATVWGLPYDQAAGGWQVTSYDDGRPLAGVLSDGWVFTRMPSTENNRHRERAALIASAFICHDYANRPVKIPQDIDLTSEAAIANAIEHNEVCVGCHHTLDPLASFFTVHDALRIPAYESSYPLTQFTPDAGAGYEPPAWYGEPAAGLAELGTLIADDPRFSSCMVRRFYSELMHVPLDDVPQTAISKYLPSFASLNVKSLVRAIVLSDEFAADAALDPAEAPLDVGLRRATPQQLDTMFLDLVGYQWRANIDFDIGSGVVGEVPLMRDYLWGYRTLAGAPNNFDTIHHLRTADPTTLLTLRSLAERAARHVVEYDFNVSPEQAYLLRVPGVQEGDTTANQQQLAELHLRLYGQWLDIADPHVEASLQLLTAAHTSSGDLQRAWQVTLAAMFQDPRIVYY